MTRATKSWHFIYVRDGETVEGHASIGIPRRESVGIDWEVPVSCDILPGLKTIPGISPEGSIKLAESFLKEVYIHLDLRKTDGTAFEWTHPSAS